MSSSISSRPSLNDAPANRDSPSHGPPGEDPPLRRNDLPLAQIADLLDVPEGDLRDLLSGRRLPEGDTTLVALTVTEAARRIGVGRTKLYEYVTSGEIASVKIGSLRRIPAEAVNDFLARRLTARDFRAAA